MILYELGRLGHYVPILKVGATARALDPFQFSALMLRESGAGYGDGYAPPGDPCGWGDGGHAFGLFQIDKRFHAAFIFGPLAHEPLQQALYAANLLATDRRELARHVPQDDGGTLLTLCMYDSYNAGDGSVLARIAAGEDPDLATTGHNYAQQIVQKAAQLQAAAPDLFI